MKKTLATAAALGALLPAPALAAALNPADVAWMMMATALVMVMTPAGLALFYGGLTQRKSTLNTIGMAYTAYCVGTVAWVVAGYTIAFGDDTNPFWGGLGKVMLRGIGAEDLVGTIPEVLFVAFQGTFAGIAVAIVSGAIVERVRFSAWLVFCVFWTLLCYAPIAHFVWGGGFLSDGGELDFAGGTVVHINAGVAGLVVAFLIGRRKFGPEKHLPYSVKLTMLGAALLWFGWFGFNAGSALAADFVAANAVLITNLAAAAGGVTWLLIEWLRRKPRSLVGTASGVISGLVGITPAAGFVDATGAMMIGVLSGAVGYFAVMQIKTMFNYDDTLDAFGIHGVVGIAGSLATGLFANPAINGAAGLFYGNPGQVVTQAIAVVATIAYCVVATAVCFYAATLITRGTRVSELVEEQGMDAAYHNEQDSHSGDASPTEERL